MDYPLHAPGSLVDSVYEIIKKEIACSYLRPGDKLNSRILAERYQVSETPIKQALNRLITEGLVESIPRKGMRVCKITWEEIDEVLELRQMLDTFFVSDVIKNLRNAPDLAEKLQKIIRMQTACLELIEDTEYYNETYELDSRFHELYIYFSGNSKALDVFRNLNSHLYSNFIYGRQPREQTLEGIQEHQAILDALTAEDEDQAKKLIILHISNARKHIYAALKQNKL